METVSLLLFGWSIDISLPQPRLLGRGREGKGSLIFFNIYFIESGFIFYKNIDVVLSSRFNEPFFCLFFDILYIKLFYRWHCCRRGCVGTRGQMNIDFVYFEVRNLCRPLYLMQ